MSFYNDKLSTADFPLVYLWVRSFGVIRISDPRSFGSPQRNAPLDIAAKLDTRENTEYTGDQVSEGKLGVQKFVNLSNFFQRYD